MVQRELWILQRAQLAAGGGMLTNEQRQAIQNEPSADRAQPEPGREPVTSPAGHRR
jgi:hypothetical protein